MASKKATTPRNWVLDNLVACDESYTFDLKLEASGSDNNVVPFEAIAYSGGKLHVDGFPHPVVVDLRAMSIAGANGDTNEIPVTLDHDNLKRVGLTSTVTNNGRQIHMTGATNANSPARDEVVASARSGYRWAFSIEGNVRKGELVRQGNSRYVNGREQHGPFIHATKFILRKVSAVTAGGDEKNVVRIAAAAKEHDMPDIDQGFAEWLEAQAIIPSETPEATLTALLKSYDQELKAEAGKDDPPPPEPAEKITAESAVASVTAPTIPSTTIALRAAAKAENDRLAMIETVIGSNNRILMARAIEEGWDQTKCELEAMKDRLKTPEDFSTAIEPDTPERDRGRALEASLCRRAGISDELLLKEYGEKTMELSDARDLRDIGLHYLLHATCKAAGKHVRAGVVNNDLISTAFEADKELKANAGFSTLGLTAVLSNVANKRLLASYQSYPMVATQICGTSDVSDFKEASAYRVTTQGLLLKLGPSGEIKHTEISATEFKEKIDTFARMLVIDRRMFINDDLGAFTQAASQFGRLAAKTIDYWFHKTLLDNVGPFFDAANGNIITPGSALDVATLTEAELTFMNLVDDAGHPMMLVPGRLLVSPGNKTTAERLFNEQRMDAVGATDAVVFANNPHAGKYVPVTSPWLNKTTLFPNASDTGWYLTALPSDLSFMNLTFLRGQRNPTVEQSQADFNNLGVQWRAYHDFGLNFVEPKAAVYNAGA